MTAAEILALVAAAGLAVLAALRVYQRRRRRAALGAAAAALLGLYAAGAVPDVPDLAAELKRGADNLGAWAYAAVAAMAFFETAAPPLTAAFPGEWGVVIGGLLASEGQIQLVPLLVVVWAASMMGDSCGFLLGRRLGRGYLVRHGARFGVTRHRLRALDAFFERWGPPTVALGRLVPFVRPFVSFSAGASDWPYLRFLRWSLLGTALFAGAYTLLGYGAYATAERVIELGGRVSLVVISAAVLAVALVLLRGRAVRRRHLARAQQEPAGEGGA